MTKNFFLHTNSNKRYYTLDYYYKKIYHTKVCKISLNAGFSCPNIDGTKGKKGCIYCSNLGSGDFAGNSHDPIPIQFQKQKQMMLKKWPNASFIGYFQAHTNTYAPLSILKQTYESILNESNLVGINIATRADSISNECLDYLQALNQQTDITIELGLQTIHKSTSKLINRCHDLNTFEQMVYKLDKRNLKVIVHIINGLPYESKEMMIKTVQYLNKLPIMGIKIHMLHVLKNTPLAQFYQKNKFHILTQKEYTQITCDQLEHLREDIVVCRITGDPDKEQLITPSWLLKKFGVLNEIDKELQRRNTCQGFQQSLIPFLKRELSYFKEKDFIYSQIDLSFQTKIKTTSILLEQKMSLLILTKLENTIEYYLSMLHPKGTILLISKEKKISFPKDIFFLTYKQASYYIFKIKKEH